MNKKHIYILFLIFFNCIMMITNIYALNLDKYLAQQVKFNIFVNDDEQSFEKPIFVINDETYVPLREVCNKLDYNIKWFDDERKIEIYKEEKFNDNNSEEGILQNGETYKFLGTDNYDKFNFERFIKKGNFYNTTEYKIKIYAKTPYEVAAKSLKYIAAGTPPEETVLIIRYDSDSDSWIVYPDFSKISGVKLGGNIFLKISRNDGTMVMYDNGVR